MTRDYFLRVFRYNLLANLRIIDALRPLERACEEELALLGHILHAEKLWFLRLEGFDTGSLAVWPRLTLNECAELAKINASTAAAYLERLGEGDTGQKVQYQTSAGDVFSSTIIDILTHLSHHGTYHRAQINRMLREKGDGPAVLDFISFARDRWE